MGFVVNFIYFPTVQKFWKSVKIWQSYREFKGGSSFLRHSALFLMLLLLLLVKMTTRPWTDDECHCCQIAAVARCHPTLSDRNRQTRGNLYWEPTGHTYVPRHTQTDRHRHRHTDRHTDRHVETFTESRLRTLTYLETHRQTDRDIQRDRQTDRHRETFTESRLGTLTYLETHRQTDIDIYKQTDIQTDTWKPLLRADWAHLRT